MSRRRTDPPATEPVDEPEGASIPIVSPSFRRAKTATVDQAFPKDVIKICVAEFEADEYREHHPDVEIVPHPDDVVGLPLTRQWIYEHFGDVVMVDDDIVGLIHLEHKTGDRFERNGRMYSQHHLTPEENAMVLWRLAEEARQYGCFLFGINPSGDPRNYRDLSPYRLTGNVDGSVLGMLAGSRLFYHKDFVSTEAYWISCLNAYFHRKALIDTRYGVIEAGGNFVNTGGLTVYRTEEVEKQGTLSLQRFFGEDIVRDRRGQSKKNQRANSITEWQRDICLPF